MNIDQKASLKAKKEIEIDAPVDKVWSLLTGIDDWARWQPDVTSARLDGDLSVGTEFKWKAMGLKITSSIEELEPSKRIGWTGKSIGMKAVHRWNFDPQGNLTHVITEESLSGWFPGVLKIFDPAFLEKSLTGSLQVLKAEAERKKGASDELSSNKPGIAFLA